MTRLLILVAALALLSCRTGNPGAPYWSGVSSGLVNPYQAPALVPPPPRQSTTTCRAIANTLSCTTY